MTTNLAIRKEDLNIPETEFNYLQQLFKITDNKVDNIDGKGLWAFLKINTKYRSWISRRLNEYAIGEGKDYFIVEESGNHGGSKKKSYFLNSTLTRDLAVCENNEYGKMVRDYLYACEKFTRTQLELSSNVPAMMTIDQINDIKSLIIDEIENHSLVINAKTDYRFDLLTNQLGVSFKNVHIDSERTNDIVISESSDMNKNIAAKFQNLDTNLTTNFKNLAIVIKALGSLLPITTISKTIRKVVTAVTPTITKPILPNYPISTLDASDYLNSYVRYQKGSWNNGWTRSTQKKLFKIMRNLGWVCGISPVDKYVQLGYVTKHNNINIEQTRINPIGIEELFKELQRQGIII
jgi:phage anti-repressor protein